MKMHEAHNCKMWVHDLVEEKRKRNPYRTHKPHNDIETRLMGIERRKGIIRTGRLPGGFV